jgi:acetoin utilization deacetylase AcuC-like enzyme
MPIPVISSPRGLGYQPDVEIQCGVALRGFDAPERHAAVLAAVHGRPDVELREPTEHGLAPVHAVHDAGMVSFLETAWERLSPLRPDPERRLLFPDTFPHPGFGAALAAGSVQRVAGLGELGRYCFDTITGIGPGTYDAARSSADVALTAADAVLAGAPLSVSLNRPPGHHAAPAMFGGGTFLNNAAIAAQALRAGGVARVAVLDVDFHHGNGTQAIFYDRPDVLFASLHGAPARTWPFFSGWPEERGTGDGEGANHNVVLPPGITGARYRELLAGALDVVRAFGAQALVVSLGFDTAAGDPAGDGALDDGDFHAIGRDIAASGLPVVTILEGGYLLDRLTGQLTAWLDGAGA